MNEEQIIKIFRDKNYRATPQRVAIFNYLYEHPTHPDVQNLYENISKLYPTFSKTTVYNALESLEANGFIKAVTIDNKMIHYDANTSFHGHFKCKKCNKIFDFKIDSLKSSLGEGFEILNKDVYYTGLCPECNKV